MEAEGGWNGWHSLDDFPLFSPDDSFNLLGDYSLDLDFNNLLASPVLPVDNDVDLGGWESNEVFSAVQQSLSLPLSSILEQQNDLIINSDTKIIASENTPISVPSAAQAPSPEHQLSTGDSAAFGTGKDEKVQQPKATTTKRKFFNAFSVSNGKEVRLHTRKRFSAERKKVVALNRMIGACLHCRLRKVGVGQVKVHSNTE